MHWDESRERGYDLFSGDGGTERACEALGVKEDEVREFDVMDGFNRNRLYGFICRRSDHRYGAMVILGVNDESCEQVIWGTPKQHYPFDRNGKFNWPKVVKIQAWEKLDGTNILAYHYKYKCDDFVTFKTRLTPVVKDMGFGLFESMWREILKRETWVNAAIAANPEHNLSFELYGQRNPITVKYETPLDAALLFGVRRVDHAICPPTALKTDGAKLPQSYAVLGGDLTGVYNSFRESMARENDAELVVEGMVLYAHVGEPSWRQFKCKPEQIEKIHWANGGIPKNAVWTTAVNAYEATDKPTVDDIIELLKEEYNETQIEKSISRIHKIHSEVYYHMVFVGEVNKAWGVAAEKGFDVTKDKAATMRFLSQFFNKNEMRRVGSVVLKQAGLI